MRRAHSSCTMSPCAMPMRLCSHKLRQYTQLGGDCGKQVVERHDADEIACAIDYRRASHSSGTHGCYTLPEAHVRPQTQRIAGHHIPYRKAIQVSAFAQLTAYDVAI